MLFGLFESKEEKRWCLEELDLKNEIERLKAVRQGMPYFGTRYVDDDRTPEEREASRRRIRNYLQGL